MIIALSVFGQVDWSGTSGVTQQRMEISDTGGEDNVVQYHAPSIQSL